MLHIMFPLYSLEIALWKTFVYISVSNVLVSYFSKYCSPAHAVDHASAAHVIELSYGVTKKKFLIDLKIHNIW